MDGADAVLGIVAARIRARPLRGVLTSFGVAVATAMLLGAGAGAQLAGDNELRRAVGALTPGDRSLTVSYSTGLLDAADRHAKDRTAISALRMLSAGVVRREVLLRALSDNHGGVFGFAGIDQLAAVTHLETGRMPRTCQPTACQVLVVGAASPRLDPALGLVIVGRGRLTDPTLIAGTFAPAAGETLLLADGVAAADRVSALSAILRSYGWVLAIPHAALRVDTADAFARRMAQAAASVSVDGETLTAPDRAVAAAAATARSATRRLVLLGGEVATLLGGFALLSALGLRRGHRGVLDLLAARGARPVQMWLFTITEGAWPVLIGSGGGFSVVAVVLRHYGARLDPASPLLIGTLVVITTLGVVGVLRLRDRPPRRGLTLADGIGIAAVCVIAVAAARGAATTTSLAGSNDPLLALVPLLGAVATACVAIRVVPLLLAAAARLTPRRAPLARLALTDASRRPVVVLATAGFLAACAAITLFVAAYRATLTTGAADEAAYQVPFDWRLGVSPTLVTPESVTPPGGYGMLTRGMVASAVLRRSAAVYTTSVTDTPITLIGIAPDTAGSVHRWRSDTGLSLAALASAIRFPTPTGIAGAVIPDAARTLTVSAAGDTRQLAVSLIVAAPDTPTRAIPALGGSATPLRYPLGHHHHARLVGFLIEESAYAADRILHRIGEGSSFPAPVTGQVRLGPVTTDTVETVPVAYASLRTVGARRVDQRPDAITVGLALQGGSAVVRATQTTDTTPLRVVCDPQTATAARNGSVLINAYTPTALHALITGAASWFPTISGAFCVTDEAALATALDAATPGLGTPDEEWLAAASRSAQDRIGAALARAPLDTLAISSRGATQHALATEPLAQASVMLLALAAAAGLVLGGVSLLLVTASDLADHAGSHYALEADGVTPRALRRLVFFRVCAVAVAAAPVGVAGGVALTRLVVSLVAVTAAAQDPVPPLAAQAALPLGVTALVVTLVVSVTVCATVCMFAFREPLPPRDAVSVR